MARLAPLPIGVTLPPSNIIRVKGPEIDIFFDMDKFVKFRTEKSVRLAFDISNLQIKVLIFCNSRTLLHVVTQNVVNG